ncbi:MAG: diguanylate cyclase [Thiobacillaceae bacterium]|nr:diguanylate cyclase [Thiobacillaceae bacterium]
MIEDARRRFEDLKATGLLPSPKGVALAVLELTQKPDASIQSLTRLVQTDPAMAGRLLRYANAAHGGSLRHIASLPHAIVFLGLFRVRQIALGFSLIDQYRAGGCASFDYLGYWTASLAAGITAQQVAHQAQCPPDESFTCGLLSGVGRLALATVFPHEYDGLLARNLTGLDLRGAEAERFGLHHADLSGELLQDWGLPEIFCQAVRHHELPAEAPFAPGSRVQALTAVLHFAAKVGHLLTMDAAQRWERVPSLYHAAAQLGLEDHEVPPLFEAIVGQWQDWGRELRLPTHDFSDLRTLLTAPPDPAAGGGDASLVVMPLRVALVARNAALLRRLADTLDGMGLGVELATDRDGAARLLRDGATDIVMVELDGAGAESADLLRALRDTPGGRHAYCIALIPPEAEADVARLMLAGASDYLLHQHSEAALLARLNTAQRVVALQGAVRAERESVARSSGEWARSNRRLMQEALTDPLTQVPNRRYGLDRFAQEWSFAAHSGTPLACLMLDIDHFKRINDERGHDVGDLVLAQVARAVEDTCRKNDVVFRYGGEEFCVVCPSTQLSDAVLLGGRIVKAVRQGRFGEEGNRFPVTLSVGVAVRSADTPDAEALIARADRALYHAKANGRDRVMAARGEEVG